MPDQDIDRLLASLDSEEEDATDEVSENRPNRGIKQLREAFENEKRSKRKLEKELEELRTFRVQVESDRKVSTLTGAGLSERQASAFLKMYEDVTPENVQSFKADILGVTTSEGERTDSAFAPTQVQSEPDSGKISKQDFEHIMRSNPAKGWEILNSGRVHF